MTTTKEPRCPSQNIAFIANKDINKIQRNAGTKMQSLLPLSPLVLNGKIFRDMNFIILFP